MPATFDNLAADRSWLDPAVFARVDNLELVARFIVEGFLLGLHRSPYHGYAAEFAAYREYAPGDDLRFVDWKVYGRSDRFYVKQFSENTNLACLIALDCSGSMALAGGRSGLTKYRYAGTIAAALTHLLTKQGDAVGLLAFREGAAELLPPRTGPAHRARIYRTILEQAPRAGTDSGLGLARALEQVRRRGLVILLSDLLTDAGEVLNGLRLLRGAGQEVIVIQVLTPEERDFPFRDLTEFIDAETGERLTTQPSYIAGEYRRLLAEHVGALREGCRAHAIDFVELSTAEPVAAALVAYLARRAAQR